MANGNGQGIIPAWILPILSGLLLAAVTAVGWYARDTREIMHTNRERLGIAETQVTNNVKGIDEVKLKIDDLDSKMDKRFDDILRELRHDRSGN